MLKYRLQRRFPKTNAEVKQYLKEEWEKIGVEDYKKYIRSIRALLGCDTGWWRAHEMVVADYKMTFCI